MLVRVSRRAGYSLDSAAVTLAMPAFRKYDGRDGVARRLREENLDLVNQTAADAPPQPA
jgi:hypothetical protein